MLASGPGTSASDTFAMPSNSMRMATSAASPFAPCHAQTVTDSSSRSCTQLPPFFQTTSFPLESAPTIRIGPARRSSPPDLTATRSAFDANAYSRPHTDTTPSFASTSVHGAGTAPIAAIAAIPTDNTTMCLIVFIADFPQEITFLSPF